MKFVKGMGAGMAAGMIAGAVGSSLVRSNKKGLKKKAVSYTHLDVYKRQV